MAGRAGGNPAAIPWTRRDSGRRAHTEPRRVHDDGVADGAAEQGDREPDRGADGNVTYISLPGGIRTLFTGLGVYYPDGRPTQRIGIVPDIVVRPTVVGVRAGRDEVLDRALEYIRTGR